MTRSPSLLWLIDKLRRFGPAREGVAVVEFALVLPIMLTMYIGSIELSQAYNMDERVINIAGAVGDLVSRTNGTLTSSTLQDYFQASQAIIAPFPTTSLQQVVSVCTVNAAGTAATVEWGKGYNGANDPVAGRPCSATHPIPQAMLTISKGAWIIVSEASYVYPPMLGLFFSNSFNLYHQNFYLPRYAADIPFNASG